MSVRAEFVTLSIVEDANVRELFRRFGSSPETGYKWMVRLRAEGEAGIAVDPIIRTTGGQFLGSVNNHGQYGSRLDVAVRRS